LDAEGLNVLMSAMIENELFTGYQIGRDVPTIVSHPQLANDTLILGEKSWLMLEQCEQF